MFYCIIQMFMRSGQYGISWNDRVCLGDKTTRIKLRSKCTVQASNQYVDTFVEAKLIR